MPNWSNITFKYRCLAVFILEILAGSHSKPSQHFTLNFPVLVHSFRMINLIKNPVGRDTKYVIQTKRVLEQVNIKIAISPNHRRQKGTGACHGWVVLSNPFPGLRFFEMPVSKLNIPMKHHASSCNRMHYQESHGPTHHPFSSRIGFIY